MKILKYDIKIDTLVQRGIKAIKDDFAIYLVTGFQGSGKTYFAIYDTYNRFPHKPIYTNIKSLSIPGRDITYFTNLSEIYSFNDDSSVFIIDELSKAFPKECKQDRAFYSWLQQSRKHRRYVYLITQEYIQVPTWLRGVANQVFTTRKFILNTFITSLGSPVLNDETKEWETINHLYIIYKRLKKYSSFYDTLEVINSL